MWHRNDRKAGWRGLLHATLACLTLVACDVVKIEKLDDLIKAAASRSEANSAAAQAPAETAPADASVETDSTLLAALGSRKRTMDSIEPENSMRLYYQFVDERGTVRFVERLDEVPEAWRERVGFVEMDRPPPLTPAEARKTWAPDLNKVLAAEMRVAAVSRAREPDVILYSADWCGYCTRAKQHLDREGIRYDERNVDRPSVARELEKKTGRGGVPVLDIEGQILRGYKKAAYDQLLSTL